MSTTSVFSLSLLRRFIGSLISADGVSTVADARLGGLFSSFVEHGIPLLSRHVGHNLTKREISSLGTLQS